MTETPAASTPEPAPAGVPAPGPEPAPEVPAEPEPALDLASLPPFSLDSGALLRAAWTVLTAPRTDASMPDVATGALAELDRIDSQNARLAEQFLAEGQREFAAHRHATFGPLRTWRDTGQPSEPCDRQWMTPEPEYVS